ALRYLLQLILLLLNFSAIAQQDADSIFSFRMFADVRITFDNPRNFSFKKRTIIVLFALPNGNTTEQTMGKKMAQGDDWHFDIQYIRAQTKFLREKLSLENFVVIYLENDFKAWPTWTQKHSDYLNL